MDCFFGNLLIKTQTLYLIDFSLVNLDLIRYELILDILENLINIVILFSTTPKHWKCLGFLPTNQLIIKNTISQNSVHIMLSFLITQKLVNFINQNNNQSIFCLLLQFLKLPLSPIKRLFAKTIHNQKNNISILVVHFGHRHEPFLTASVPNMKHQLPIIQLVLLISKGSPNCVRNVPTKRPVHKLLNNGRLSNRSFS